MTVDQKNELTIVRTFDAPRARVWRACTEVEALRQWWGLPTGAVMHTCKVDFRVGGRKLCEIEQPGRPRVWFKWNYVEIVAGERLVLEQHFSDAAGNDRDSGERPVSTVRLVLEDANGKTKMTITHTGMASELYRVENFRAGWSQSLHRLEEHLVAGQTREHPR